MRAITMNGPGGPGVLEYVERPDPVAGPGEALVEITFAGVNFMDIGVRQGSWHIAEIELRRTILDVPLAFKSAESRPSYR